jgi:predicted LPLAT superfamily acyltransferase
MFVLALLASAGVCYFFGREGFETDLLALVGRQGTVIEALSEKSSSQIRVYCPDEETTQRMRKVFRFDDPIDPTNILALVRTHGKGLLSEKHRAQLLAGETNKIVRSAMRRDYSGVGLFPKEDDPYYFLNDFVMDFRAFAPNLPEGAALLTADVRGREDKVGGLAMYAHKCCPSPPALSGAPFHAAQSETSTKFQITILGGISLFAVLMIGLWLFGSYRFVLPMALALGTGYLVASAAVLLLPGRPHVLTFLFGTTLIGLGVDYCYHALSRDEDDESHFVRNLTAALVTTCLAFSPLFFSAVAVLNQMAVFTVAGLVAIYAEVLVFSRRASGTDGTAGTNGTDGTRASLITRKTRWVCVALFVAAVAGVFRLGFGNDPASFYKMSGSLARGEAKVAEVLGYSDARLALVDSADFEGWQRENAALKAKMGVEPTGEFLSAADLPRQMTLSFEGRDYLVLAAPMAKVLAPGLARIVDTKAELQSMFDTLAAETIRLVAFAFAVMALALLVIFRRRFFVFVAPVACALAATAGALGWIGAPVNFFQLLCFFILVGLGIDYSIFHKGEIDVRSAKVVFASFLTSLVGLGMLSFTSFPVTRSMGVTLGIGLFFAYLLSLPTVRDVDRLLSDRVGAADAPRGDASNSWVDQPQRGAGKIRMWAIFLTYRILGKSFTKFVCIFIILCVYPWAKPVRAALRIFAKILTGDASTVSPFRVMLNFAWAMVDKMDACCLRKSLPKMTVKGDEGWMKGGCFLLSTHVGCIEVLPALGAKAAKAPLVHAFQQMGRDEIYTSYFVRYLDKSQMALHAVEDIGVETAVEMKEAIGRGDVVLMAGDRLSAGTGRTAALRHEFLGRDCAFPKGVFRFAKLMECPVYAITCVRVGWNAYEVEAKRMGADLLGDYAAFLESAARLHPDQWFQFYDFFA